MYDIIMLEDGPDSGDNSLDQSTFSAAWSSRNCHSEKERSHLPDEPNYAGFEVQWP